MLDHIYLLANLPFYLSTYLSIYLSHSADGYISAQIEALAAPADQQARETALAQLHLQVTYLTFILSLCIEYFQL